MKLHYRLLSWRILKQRDSWLSAPQMAICKHGTKRRVQLSQAAAGGVLQNRCS